MTHLTRVMKNIDWQRFHCLCSCIGKDLNEPQWRFMKAYLLETAVAEYSNGQLKYVGDSFHGCDFIEILSGTRIEMKFVDGCLFHKTKHTLRPATTDIKLMNSNGTNRHAGLPVSYSDYLLLVDTKGAGIVSKRVVEQYIRIGGDGIKAKIPMHAVNILTAPSDISMTIDKKDVDIKAKLKEILLNIVRDI